MYIRRFNKLNLQNIQMKSFVKRYTKTHEHGKYKKDYYHYSKIYNKEFVNNFFFDPKVEQYLEDNFNIDKCFITKDTLDEVIKNNIVHNKSISFRIYYLSKP
jgi:hypothetical protein